MFQIALCDDMEEELKQAEELLEIYREKNPALAYQIKRFENAENFFEQINESKQIPDILLMDIFMPGKTGVEAVKELREKGCKMPVIFLTTSTEHALTAFEVDALQYLVKPLEPGKFFHAMDIAFTAVKKEKKSFLVKVSGGVRQIDPDEIIYCEAQRNYQVIYLESEAVRVRITTWELEEILGSFSGYYRCGSSYILNLKRVSAIGKEEICMDNGSRIFLSKKKMAELKKRYFAYHFGENYMINIP